jgi:CheY-like chemotaxis protein
MSEATKPLRVLLLDDELPNLRTFVRCFRGLVETHAAATPAEATACLARTPVDVLLVDFSMPEMTGIDFARGALRAHPGLRIIVVTGWSEVPDIAEAIREGIVERVVQKPWDRQSLLATLLDEPPR